MKIQLDTENNTITIEEDVNLHDFYEQINNILPGGLWREFTLKVTKITEWKDPITVPHTPPYNDPWTTPFSPGITTPGITTPGITTPGIGDTPINPFWYTTTGDITGNASASMLNNGTFNLNVV